MTIGTVVYIQEHDEKADHSSIQGVARQPVYKKPSHI